MRSSRGEKAPRHAPRLYRREAELLNTELCADAHALLKYGIKEVVATTYQAISGAGKNFDDWPEMRDNVIPYIGGEEEKSEREPLRIWGSVKGGVIVPAEKPLITTQCIRVPVTDGHTAAVFVSFENKPPEGSDP